MSNNTEQHKNKGQDKKKTEKIIVQNPDLNNKNDRIVVNERHHDNKKNDNKKNDNKKNERNQVHNKNEQTNRSIFSGHGHDNKKNEQNQQLSQIKDIITEVDEAQATKERKVPKDLFETLGNAGL